MRCEFERHNYNLCPAVGQICANCKKIGHYARVCKNAKVNEINVNNTYNEINVKQTRQRVRIVYGSFEVNDKVETYILGYMGQENSKDDWFTKMYLMEINKTVTFKLDSEAKAQFQNICSRNQDQHTHQNHV